MKYACIRRMEMERDCFNRHFCILTFTLTSKTSSKDVPWIY